MINSKRLRESHNNVFVLDNQNSIDSKSNIRRRKRKSKIKKGKNKAPTAIGRNNQNISVVKVPDGSNISDESIKNETEAIAINKSSVQPSLTTEEFELSSDSSVEEKKFRSSADFYNDFLEDTNQCNNKLSSKNLPNVTFTPDTLLQQFINFMSFNGSGKPVIQTVQNGFFHYFCTSNNSQENAIFIINCIYELLPLTRFVRFSRINLHPELIIPKDGVALDDDVMTYNERDQCLKYVKKLHDKSFLLLCDTFSTCISIFDRFLAIAKVKRKFGLCTAIACYSLASQYHEAGEDVPSRKELLDHSKCGGTSESLEKMEQIIIEKLHTRWPMFVETRGVSLDYLRLFLFYLGKEVNLECCRLLMDALCCDNVMNFCPSCIALAVIQVNLLPSHVNVREQILVLAQMSNVREYEIESCSILVKEIKCKMNSNPKNDKGNWLQLFVSSTRNRSIGKVHKSSYIMAKYNNLDTIPELNECI